jgi:N6-L-threonylcarbamoyladenine synthase
MFATFLIPLFFYERPASSGTKLINMDKPVIILGIESSCDDTSAAVLKDGKILANIVANQAIHKLYGGVVPELASRAHQQNIIPVVHEAIRKAGITKEDIAALAYTRGPGLMGSLLVGTSFSKAFALGMNIPLIEVNHMQGHILAHFIEEENTKKPGFPFLCLTVSGGHTQIVLVKDHFDMKIVGETIDDAAGEAFDKAAKIMGLPYPGGPLIDKLAAEGNPDAFRFSKPRTPDFDFSFSGLKTGFMNFLNSETSKDQDFIEKHKADICASLQATIIDMLLSKLKKAAEHFNVKQIAIAGGVSANSGLRKKLYELKDELDWEVFIPKFEYCTDNAAMIAITGYYKFLRKEFGDQAAVPAACFSLETMDK